MKRREFIILTGVGATSAGVLSACGNPENRLIPALIPDEEYIPGIDYWKASTCGMCHAGCGIIVRTREHKANKIEGNPLHPGNRGGLCARGQAGLQVLYNPDRIKSPLKRTGERGSGEFAEITWPEAIKTLADRLRTTASGTESNRVTFVTDRPFGVTGLAAEALSGVLKSMALINTDRWEAIAVEYGLIYGKPQIPVFDIANASYLLSFGARFLETWHSPVMYSLAYGDFRRTPGRARGRFVQVEPRMSLTGANADEWVPAADLDLAALAIMQVMMREGLARNAIAPKFISDSLDAYAPEQVSTRIGVAADSLVRIAREFAKAEKPLALAGDISDVRVVDHLNLMVANVNKPGGVLLNDSGRPDPLGALRRAGSKAWMSVPLGGDAIYSDDDVLFLHRVNPAHTDPLTIEVSKRVRVPFIVSFASVLDETAMVADLILPDRSYLESWDIQASVFADRRTAVTLTQPVIKPEPGPMQAADALLALAAELGGTPLSFKSAEEAVKQAAGALQKAGGSITAESPEDFMTAISTHGVWSGDVPAKSPSPEAVDRPLYGIKTAQTDPAYPLTLLTYEHAALGTGESANLPMLQELPDPMTTVMWGSWVEINPKTAQELGIADGDLVEVRTPHRARRVAAVVYPAIRPDTIAMPLGQGHASYGRFARGTGANAAALLGPAVASGRVAAGISKVSGEGKLIRFGTSLPEHFDRKR